MSKLSSNDNIVNCCGETSIDELVALIQHAELMITNDTGPMHIAFSVKTPTVALFGPCLPSQYGIFEHANILYHQVYCSPCVHEFTFPPCKGNNQCMKNINLGEVFKAIEKSLSGEFSMKNYPSPIIWTEQDHSNIPLGIVSRS